MKIITVCVLVFSAWQGHGDATTSMSTLVFPTATDCRRVGDAGGSNAHCVQTRILVPAR